VFVAAYFLLFGDVEVNPGPVQCTDKGEGGNKRMDPDASAKILEAIQRQNGKFQSLEDNINFVRGDLGVIKCDIGQVMVKC
jgi:hypothetical protein